MWLPQLALGRLNLALWERTRWWRLGLAGLDVLASASSFGTATIAVMTRLKRARCSGSGDGGFDYKKAVILKGL